MATPTGGEIKIGTAATHWNRVEARHAPQQRRPAAVESPVR